MDRLFFDTNVLLDVLEARAPWFPEAVQCLALARSGECAAAISALSLSDIAYIQRATSAQSIYAAFRRLRGFLQIAKLDAACVDAAFVRRLPDIEDGFQWEAALRWRATHFLTRNVHDFPAAASLVPMTPADYLARR